MVSSKIGSVIMKIDIICPLYNAENYIEYLHNSFLKQKDINLNKIRYILTESTDNTEEYLIKNNIKPFRKEFAFLFRIIAQFFYIFLVLKIGVFHFVKTIVFMKI